MNVKHILVFTICVGVSNGLTDQEISADINRYRAIMIEQWTPITRINDGFREDEEGNIVIRVMVNAGAKYNEIFVPSLKRIGVNLTIPPPNGTPVADAALRKYLAEVFEIPESCIDVCAEDINFDWKIITLRQGCIPLKSVIYKAVDVVVKQRLRAIEKNTRLVG